MLIMPIIVQHEYNFNTLKNVILAIINTTVNRFIINNINEFLDFLIFTFSYFDYFHFLFLSLLFNFDSNIIKYF